jgi:hypothetical protein
MKRPAFHYRAAEEYRKALVVDPGKQQSKEKT